MQEELPTEQESSNNAIYLGGRELSNSTGANQSSSLVELKKGCCGNLWCPWLTIGVAAQSVVAL